MLKFGCGCARFDHLPTKRLSAARGLSGEPALLTYGATGHQVSGVLCLCFCRPEVQGQARLDGGACWRMRGAEILGIIAKSLKIRFYIVVQHTHSKAIASRLSTVAIWLQHIAGNMGGCVSARHGSPTSLSGFSFHEVLGAGTYGQVRACTENKTGIERAVKIVHLPRKKSMIEA